MSIIHIVAYSKNRVIGHQGGIPWYIPDDLKRFKCITWGGVVAMGRKTFESIGRPLPNRTNIVLTKYKSISPNTEISVCDSIEQLIQGYHRCPNPDHNLFIIGGSEIFKQTLPYVDKIIATEIDMDYPGDTYYPEIPKDFVRTYSQHMSHEGTTYRNMLYVNSKHISYRPCEICKVSSNLICSNICKKCEEIRWNNI